MRLGRGQTLLVGTRSRGKFNELAAVFERSGVQLVDLQQAGVPVTAQEDEIEQFATFEENAIAKARFYREASGGLTTVADDSGLTVAALGGAPGVRSRRWAGVAGSEAEVSETNNAKLLSALEGAFRRDARFVCAVALADASSVTVGRGEVLGRIARVPRGGNGFGYDPVFEADELGGRTFGEASDAEKGAISHRSRAFDDLVRQLEADRGGPAG